MGSVSESEVHPFSGSPCIDTVISLTTGQTQHDGFGHMSLLISSRSLSPSRSAACPFQGLPYPRDQVGLLAVSFNIPLQWDCSVPMHLPLEGYLHSGYFFGLYGLFLRHTCTLTVAWRNVPYWFERIFAMVAKRVNTWILFKSLFI